MEGGSVVELVSHKGEVWKDLEGSYLLSNLGRFYIKNWKKTGVGKLGKIHLSNKGYAKINIKRDGIHKTVSLHREVAKLFIPNPENMPLVNHIDFNRANSKATNLEWVTIQGNYDHSSKQGRMKLPKLEFCAKGNGKGSKVGTSKLKEHQVIEIRNKYVPRQYTRGMLATDYNVTVSCIKDILIRRSWKHVK